MKAPLVKRVVKRCGTYHYQVAQAGVRLPSTLEADKPALWLDLTRSRAKIGNAQVTQTIFNFDLDDSE